MTNLVIISCTMLLFAHVPVEKPAQSLWCNNFSKRIHEYLHCQSSVKEIHWKKQTTRNKFSQKCTYGIHVDLEVIEDTYEELSRCFPNFGCLAVKQTEYLNLLWEFSVFLKMETLLSGRKKYLKIKREDNSNSVISNLFISGHTETNY